MATSRSVMSVRIRLVSGGLLGFVLLAFAKKSPAYAGLFWSEREDLTLRPLVSQTSALTGLRHAPMPFP